MDHNRWKAADEQARTERKLVRAWGENKNLGLGHAENAFQNLERTEHELRILQNLSDSPSGHLYFRDASIPNPLVDPDHVKRIAEAQIKLEALKSALFEIHTELKKMKRPPVYFEPKAGN
jgi:hypothetical protein